jgi:ribose-phosphate pyrophosphokinase
MIDAARRASANRITAVMPFYGYARQDRKDQPRVPITAKLVANLLVPPAPIASSRWICTASRSRASSTSRSTTSTPRRSSSSTSRSRNKDNLVVCSPDVGGMKMAAAYADTIGAASGLVAKKRKNATTVEAISVVGDVEGLRRAAGRRHHRDRRHAHGRRQNPPRTRRPQHPRRRQPLHPQRHRLRAPQASGLIDELITTNSVPNDTKGPAHHRPQHRRSARRGDHAHQQQRERHEPL